VAGYVGNQDFLLTGTAGRYVLKAGDGPALAAEAWACERVRACGVPAPPILATDLAGSLLGPALLVMEHLAGSPSPEPDDPAIVEAGRRLRRVHSVTMAGYGPVRVARDGTAAGECASWAEFTATALIGLPELVAQHIIEAAFADRVRVALDRHRDAVDYTGPAILLHGDLHPRHIFAAGTELTGIIDWGDVAAGDPVFDLARYSIGGQDSMENLLGGYGLSWDPELDRRFAVYRVIRMSRTLYDEFRCGGDWFDAYRRQLRMDLDRLDQTLTG
ncbi:MAG TPA: aminoglycoside phosphotransferase family protein, partial [Mycobacteriales bacterium]|nr:aminoglycoside phosphotransferase family protein [Mycobacteriales bacterium]